jgi:hypothetical protein
MSSGSFRRGSGFSAASAATSPTTRTFYKPDSAIHGKPTNFDYWNAQKETR